jgi:hypothetical protein
MSYDPKCEELARHFLPGGAERLVEVMAQRIQDHVEEEIRILLECLLEIENKENIQ